MDKRFLPRTLIHCSQHNKTLELHSILQFHFTSRMLYPCSESLLYYTQEAHGFTFTAYAWRPNQNPLTVIHVLIQNEWALVMEPETLCPLMSVNETRCLKDSAAVKRPSWTLRDMSWKCRQEWRWVSLKKGTSSKTKQAYMSGFSYQTLFSANQRNQEYVEQQIVVGLDI